MKDVGKGGEEVTGNPLVIGKPGVSYESRTTRW
jgi:hypothetical protein